MSKLTNRGFLSYDQREKKTRKIGNKTFNEAKSILSEHGRCLVVRPTGMGKTFLLMRLAEYYSKKYPKKKIIYLYPTDIIVNEIKNNPSYEDIYDKVKFVSYQTLSLAFDFDDAGNRVAMIKGRQSSVDLRVKRQNEIIDDFRSASIILCDEIHRVGSDKLINFFNHYDNLFGVDKTHLIGVTATINRVNNEESNWIIQELFKNHQVFDYTLADAFNDGILQIPFIYKPIFNLDKRTEALKREIYDNPALTRYISIEEYKQECDQLARDWGSNGKDIYRVFNSQNYDFTSDDSDDSFIRLIVFFGNVKHMYTEGPVIESYFREAFNNVASEETGENIETDMIVEYVVSDTADKKNNNIIRKRCEEKDYRIYRNNAKEVCLRNVIDADGKVSVVPILPKGKTVHLIFNVDVIVMGYHVPHISGVMLLRSPGTSIMFNQQIGRCFSVTNKRRPIIFDVFSSTDKIFKEDDISIDMAVKEILGDAIELNNLYDVRVNTVQNKNDDDELDTIIDEYSDDDGIDFDLERGDAIKAKDYDPLATESYLARFSTLVDSDSLAMNRVKYLYSVKNMPIAFIATDLDLPCNKVIEILVRTGIHIKMESAEAAYLMEGIADEPEDQINLKENYKLNLLKYVLDPEASKVADKWGIKKTLLSVFRSMHRGVRKR